MFVSYAGINTSKMCSHEWPWANNCSTSWRRPWNASRAIVRTFCPIVCSPCANANLSDVDPAAGARWSVYSRDIGGLRWCVVHRSSTKSFRAATWSERFVRLETFSSRQAGGCETWIWASLGKRDPLPRRSNSRSLRRRLQKRCFLKDARGGPDPTWQDYCLRRF